MCRAFTRFANTNRPNTSTAASGSARAGGEAHDVAGVFSIFTGINITSGFDAIQYDFCEKPPGSISGRIHADTGRGLRLRRPRDAARGRASRSARRRWQPARTTLTNADGEYSFTGLAPGDYQVREHQPTEYYDGGERVGTAGGASHDVGEQFSFFTGIHITAGLDANQYDFCEKIGVMLSGNVYHDRVERRRVRPHDGRRHRGRRA